jgi:hypothetical protein
MVVTLLLYAPSRSPPSCRSAQGDPRVPHRAAGTYSPPRPLLAAGRTWWGRSESTTKSSLARCGAESQGGGPGAWWRSAGRGTAWARRPTAEQGGQGGPEVARSAVVVQIKPDLMFLLVEAGDASDGGLLRGRRGGGPAAVAGLDLWPAALLPAGCCLHR